MKRAVIGRKKAGFAQFFRFRGDRSARRDGGERESVDKPTEEIRMMDEITRNRSGRRGASGDFPELEMNQNSFDDCRILEEADDGHRPLTLWADERIGFVDLLD